MWRVARSKSMTGTGVSPNTPGCHLSFLWHRIRFLCSLLSSTTPHMFAHMSDTTYTPSGGPPKGGTSGESKIRRKEFRQWEIDNQIQVWKWILSYSRALLPSALIFPDDFNNFFKNSFIIPVHWLTPAYPLMGGFFWGIFSRTRSTPLEMLFRERKLLLYYFSLLPLVVPWTGSESFTFVI